MLKTRITPELFLNRILFLIIIMTMIFLLSCSKDTTSPEDNDLKLMLSPVDQTVPMNIEADFVVKIENADNLFAFSTEIVFDNSIAEFVQDAVVIGSFWNSELVELSVVEDDRLSITISLQQTSSEDGIDGSGDLFTFSIIGSTLGSSNLTFENLLMIDEDGEPISNFNEIEIINGTLTVE